MFKQLMAEYLGMIVSTLIIITTVGGYASTKADDSELKDLKILHVKDMNIIKKQMVKNNFIKYDDKIEALLLKPNRTEYENNLLELNRQKRKNVEVELKNL